MLKFEFSLIHFNLKSRSSLVLVKFLLLLLL